jgi:hypothetical protein
MNVTFTKAEAEFIGQTSILKKVEKLTEGNEEKGGENSAAAVAGRQ